MKRIMVLACFLLFVVQTTFASASLPYSDIPEGYKKHNVLEFMYNRSIMTGYPDGTFQPDKILNRAELLKIIVASTFDESIYGEYVSDECFTDVDGTQWYNEYVCYGKEIGVVEGYEDGTFKPAQDVNMVEALKMMLVGMNVEINDASSGGEWYLKYLETAQAKYLLPDSLQDASVTNNISRIQAAEIIKNIISLNANVIQPPVYTSDGGYEPGNVYLGYMQEGAVAEIYLIADNNIEEVVVFDEVKFSLNNNTVVNSSIADQNTTLNFENPDVVFKSLTPVRANEVLHIATLYLKSDSQINIVNKP